MAMELGGLLLAPVKLEKVEMGVLAEKEEMEALVVAEQAEYHMVFIDPALPLPFPVQIQSLQDPAVQAEVRVAIQDPMALTEL